MIDTPPSITGPPTYETSRTRYPIASAPRIFSRTLDPRTENAILPASFPDYDFSTLLKRNSPAYLTFKQTNLLR